MKYLDPKNDFIFKKVFGQHPDILKSFLNALLPLKDGHEIVELEYLNPDMVPDTFLEKFSAVDVRCIDKQGRQFLVEMQMNWTTAFKQRVLFNASKAYVTQSTKGVDFGQLKPVYALNLINQNYLIDSPEYYHHYAVVHLKDTDEKLEGLEFVFIELEKFKAKNINEKKLQVLWLRFLTEINENTQQIPGELLEQPDIKKAISQVEEASMSKEDKLLYEKNWDRIRSEQTIIIAAEEKGRIVGEKIGIEKGEKIGINKTCLKMLRKQIPIEEISEFSEMSGNKISKLQELLSKYGNEAENYLDEIKG